MRQVFGRHFNAQTGVLIGLEVSLNSRNKISGIASPELSQYKVTKFSTRSEI